MYPVDQYITPHIESQFPRLYQEEGQLFIAFVKAYYEWLENNLQVISIERTNGFNIGDIITQGVSVGKILSEYNGKFIVQVISKDDFIPRDRTTNLQTVYSTGGGQSFIDDVENFNAIYFSRNLGRLRDIDQTIDSFIVHFKNKYLPNIQFTTASNKELFIKNALNFYRAKGSEQAVDLFFKLIYGFEAKVYYPSTDLFRLSDNRWANLQYLELEPKDTNIQMVGQVVYGAISGASGYGERLIRVKRNGRFVNVLHLSTVKGTFQTYEQVYTKDLDVNVTSRMHGSTTSFTEIISAPGFNIGERLDVVDGLGHRATARVRSTESFNGAIIFKLLDGGWGYSSEYTQIIGSDAVLLLDNVVFESTDYFEQNKPLETFDKIQQDLHYYELNTENETIFFNEGDVVDCSNSTGAVITGGTVVTSNPETSSIVVAYEHTTTDAGSLGGVTTVELSSDASHVLTTTGTNIDASVNGEVVDSSIDVAYIYEVYVDPVTSRVPTPSEVLTVGDVIKQYITINGNQIEVASATIIDTEFIPVSAQYKITVEHNEGYIRGHLPIYSTQKGIYYTINYTSSMRVGIRDEQLVTVDVSGTVAPRFYRFAPIRQINSSDPANPLTANALAVYRYSIEASVDVQDIDDVVELSNFHTGNFITNEIAYASDDINVTSINTSQFLTEYGASSIKVALDTLRGVTTNFSNLNVGSIDKIKVINLGEGYPVDPFFIIVDESMNHLDLYDFKIKMSEENQLFRIGEKVIGQTSGCVGRVRSIDYVTNEMEVTRLSIGRYKTNDALSGTITNITVDSTVVNSSLVEIDSHTCTITGDVDSVWQTELQIGDIIKVETDEAVVLSISSDSQIVVRGDINANTDFVIDNKLYLTYPSRRDFQYGEAITGQDSNVTTFISFVEEIRREDKTGMNAKLQSKSFFGGGFIQSLDVIDSGFGYYNNEFVNLVSRDDPTKTATAVINLGEHGRSEGYWLTNNSFLSSNKYLHDNDYYQEYSYDILTSLPFDVYKDTLKKVLHVAGTKPFGTYVSTRKIGMSITGSSVITTVQ